MSTSPTEGTVTLEEFRKLVAQHLEIDEAKVVAEASFAEDLLADSIQLVDLMLRFEERGIRIPLEEAWQVRTVGDAYQVYLKATSSAG
jgi:acyl carrier protein